MPEQDMPEFMSDREARAPTVFGVFVDYLPGTGAVNQSAAGFPGL